MAASDEVPHRTPDPGHPPWGLGACYRALDEAARRHGLDALGIAIEDPDLGRQCLAAGPDASAARTVLATLASDPERWWSATPAPDAAPDDLTTLRALGATALRLGVHHGDPDPITELEVALRTMPEVATVGRRGTALEVTAREGGSDALVQRLAAGDLDAAGGIVIVLAAGSEPGTPLADAPARAELVAVRSVPETGEVEVHLRRAARRAVGRGPLSRAGGASAAATLDALGDLAHPGPHAGTIRSWKVVWARTIETTPERRFLVAVAIHRPSEPMLYGLATGTSPIEAAARAALHACNRAASA